MDDNTKVMLKLATLLAQQNNARVNNTPEQNPLTELATQLLMNSANETLAIPTSMQLNPAKQPQPQHDNHNSNSYATQAMTTQPMDTSNHIEDTYETSHNQRVGEGDIKPITNQTPEVAKDMINLAPPVNRNSYGIVSPAIGDSSESYPLSKDDFNSKPTNSLLNPSTMNQDMFTSSDCRDSYTGNRGNLFPSSSSSNRDTYTAASVVNDAQQPLDRNSLTTSTTSLDRETFCNSIASQDNFNLSRDNNTSMTPVTCDAFSSNCSVTRDSSFSDNSSILRDSPINREAYNTNNLMMNQDNYLNVNINRGSFHSNTESFPMNSPNRSEETVNMMRNDLSNNSINRMQEDLSIDHDDDGMDSMSNINSSMCNINSSASEMPMNSNNCAYYKRPIQGEKGRSYPQPVMLRSRPRPAKERSKRGPKEKDYFRTAFFCLPSVTSRLPRFTSADPREQELVYEYQKKGYGFPAKDFFEGKPQKTYIRLSHDEESFRCFLLSIYPKLEGKYYELYRIDRQRNLVRIEAKTPRGIKNAKYQGTIIILPYPEASNPPSAVVHNPSSLGEFPNQLIEKSIDDIDDIDEEEGSFIQSPSISGSTPQQSPAVLQANEIATYNKEESYQNFPPSPERDIKPFQKFETEHSEFFQRISLIKQTLSETRNLKMDKRSIVGNLLELYRCEQTICNYDIRVTFNNDHNLSSSNDPAFQTRHMFCIFWKKIFDKNFVGNMEFYPVINPEADEDMFEVLGRILAHGLILCNYWPIQFALSSATFMLSNECSNELTLKSFINCLSGFEQRVVECAIQESQSQTSERYIPLDLKKDLSAFLWMYGCEMDKSRHFSDILLCIAKSLLIYQPYWALVKLKEGMDHCCSRIFMACSQSDVQSLYQALTPDASQMCKLIKYEYSLDDNQEIEKGLQTYLEKLLWELCSAELSNLLQQWTGVNCMSQQTLFVKFVSGVENVHFENYKCLLRIPRKSITFEEFKKLIKLVLDDT